MNSNNNLPKLNNDTTSETSIFKKVSSLNDKNATSSTLNDKKDSSNGKISDFKKALNYVKKIDKGFYSISKYPFDYENWS